METVPRTRVVVLGASNLTHAFPVVVSRLRSALPGPLDVLAAIGDGRSYGRTSRFLARKLPGILECGLWRALAERPRLAGRSRIDTRALIGDLGNDLVYGAEVGEIAGWIEQVLDRLLEQGARCALVHLPLGNLDRISRFRFRVARSVFYPGRAVDLDGLRSRAQELDARMTEIAAVRRVALVPQDCAWYGLDPIHLLRDRREEACSAWLAPIAEPPATPRAADLDGTERAALRRIRAERRRILGRVQFRTQPCARLLDGTTISVY